MDWKFNDGGRAEAGFKGTTGDCGVRSIAIATNQSYQIVYNDLKILASKERITKRHKIKSTVRNGLNPKTFKKYMHEMGWGFIATMGIGTGCKVHLKSDELPMGRLIARVSKHWCAVIDGVIQDTYDCSRNETRCVYGYWRNIYGDPEFK